MRSPVSKELSVFSPSPDESAASFCERPDMRRSSRSLSTRSNWLPPFVSGRAAWLLVGFVFRRAHGVRGDRRLRSLLRLRCLFLRRVDRAIRDLHEIDAGELQHVAIQLPL